MLNVALSRRNMVAYDAGSIVSMKQLMVVDGGT